MWDIKIHQPENFTKSEGSFLSSFKLFLWKFYGNSSKYERLLEFVQMNALFDVQLEGRTDR